MNRSLCASFCLASLTLHAEETSIVLGMRNSTFARVGIEHANWGLSLENSLFVSEIHTQYVRFLPTYQGWIGQSFTWMLGPFYGSRYDHLYQDAGARLQMSSLLPWHIEITGQFIPTYDTRLGMKYGCESRLSVFPSADFGVSIAEQNIAEYRDFEHRRSFGLVLRASNANIEPQVSVPSNGDFNLTRFSVSFVWRRQL